MKSDRQVIKEVSTREFREIPNLIFKYIIFEQG